MWYATDTSGNVRNDYCYYGTSTYSNTSGIDYTKFSKESLKLDCKTKRISYYGKIEKVIFSGKKTIVLFSEGDKKDKVVLTNDETSVKLSTENVLMLAVLKRASLHKDWTFFCQYVEMPEQYDQQTKLLKGFSKIVAPNGVWPYWKKSINHILYELSTKDRNKIFVIQKEQK